MKKIVKMFSALSLVVLLAACNTVVANDRVDYSNQTLVGQINEINGNTINLQLGKLKKDKTNQQNLTQMPNEGFSEQVPQTDSETQQLPEFNNERPQLPEGFEGQTVQEGEMPSENMPMPPFGKPDGQAPQMNGEMPQMPSGEQFTENSEGAQLPDNFDGQAPELPNGEMPQMPSGEQFQHNGQGPMMPNNQESYIFKSRDEFVDIDIENVEVTLADSSIGTIDDLKVGDVVEIVFDSNNKIQSLKVCSVNNDNVDNN